MVEIEKYELPTCCEWCGAPRGKKVKIAGLDNGSIVVCRKHLQHHDGTLVNEPTVRALIRLHEMND